MGGCASLATGEAPSRGITSQPKARAPMSERATATSDQDSVSSNDSDDRGKPASAHRGPMRTTQTAPLPSQSLSDSEVAAMFYRPAESDDDAQAASWFAFLCGRAPAPGAAMDSDDESLRLIDRLQQSYTASTERPLDPRVKAYCRGNTDRWAAYFTRQLSTARGGSADAGFSLKSTDAIFDRVRQAPTSGSEKEETALPGTAEDVPCPAFANDEAIPGDRLPQLMAELRLTDDVHFLYLCSRMVSSSASKDFRAVDDVWCLTRRSWRKGCIMLDALCPQRQIAVASQLARDIDAAGLHSPEFRHLYLFLWGFAPSPGNPAGRRTDGSHSPPRKCLPYEDAVEFWQLLVTPARWPYIGEWLAFLSDGSAHAHGRRSFTSDLWRQFLEFMLTFSAESDFSKYDAGAASWPSLLDEFVEWKNKRPMAST